MEILHSNKTFFDIQIADLFFHCGAPNYVAALKNKKMTDFDKKNWLYIDANNFIEAGALDMTAEQLVQDYLKR